VTEEWIQRTFAPENTFNFLTTLLPSPTSFNNVDGTVIGFLGLRLMARTSVASIGYEISPSYWNKGYLTEALSGFLRAYWKIHPEGLQDSKLDESGRVFVDATALENNAASLRVLEKAGFVSVGQETAKDWYGGPDVVLKRCRVWKPVE
jgi:RimJ/RimL family protein N-acetyltransferase